MDETPLNTLPATVDEDISSESRSLSELAKEKLTPEQLAQLKRIAYYVNQVGLSLEESCKLIDVEYDYFVKLMESQPFVRRIIEMKELEYKKDLMLTLSRKARTGDDKLAQWLLERKYPDQFSTKRPKGDGDGDMLVEAIRFIQKSGDATPMVNETSGQAIVIRKGGEVEKTNWSEKLKSILG